MAGFTIVHPEIYPLCTLAPRFIISIWELYVGNVQGTRTSGSLVGSACRCLAGGTVLVLVDVEQSETLEVIEEIVIEVPKTRLE